jgi:cytochrome d ubiquinol oxidase subunit II
MPLETIVAIFGLVALLLYAILAGADFGGGVWDFFSSGPRALPQRVVIGEAMGPVWETNHVWLIYVLVLLFTCFPPVFALLSERLFVPLTLALLGIVLRGAAFAFRGPPNRDLLPFKVWGAVFGVASLATPFFFGAAAAGIATGTFAWHGPMALAVGLFATALCAQLAAVFLSAEALGELRLDFAARAHYATAAVAICGAVALALAYGAHPSLIVHLFSPLPLAIIVLAMVLGIAVIALLRIGRVHWARVMVAAEAGAVLCAWYAAQAPYAAVQLGILHPAAPPVTLAIFIWATIAGTAVLLPSLVLLFAVFKREPIDVESLSLH